MSIPKRGDSIIELDERGDVVGHRWTIENTEPDVDPDDDELIYVFAGGTHRNAKLEARRRGLPDTWRWRHVTTLADLDELDGFDPTDLVIVDLGPVDLEVTAHLERYRPPTITDVDTGGRL